jgi:hypothetical protein
MQPSCVLAIQSTMSLVSFALIARWYLAPRLAARSREDALVPLLWINVFRYAPLALYAVGQVDPHIPRDVAAAIAYGDLISAVVALIAVIAVKLRAPGSIAVAWLFSIVSIADLVYATYKAVGAETYKYSLGWNWYILNFYVPMLVVAQVMILRVLVRKS